MGNGTKNHILKYSVSLNESLIFEKLKKMVIFEDIEQLQSQFKKPFATEDFLFFLTSIPLFCKRWFLQKKNSFLNRKIKKLSEYI